jgi:prolyl-tRNA editing enzyme YbaK/EbsC (Cys-tRNA(Pro) deacylase)
MYSIRNIRYTLLPIITQESDALTGFVHNGVSPFGSLTRVPVVLSQAAADVIPNCIFMGAGHRDFKLHMSIPDVIDILKPIVADVTDPQNGSDDSIDSNDWS